MRVKRVLYWVTIGILIAVIITCAGMIAYKLITDEVDKNDWEELLESVPERDPSQTLPTKDPNSSTDPTDPIDPNAPGPSRPRPVIDESEILFPYRSLYTINNDMVGFLEIPGTNIRYPVVQSPYQANYYLRRNFYKRSATCGTIYVREACDVNLPSDNVTIYGHNMRNGTMFADLHKYEKKAFWENHRYVNFDTLHEYRTYEIFAIFKTTADLTKGFTYHIYDTFATEKAFNEYVSTCKNLSLYDTGITPDFGDKLLTLSTCDKSISDGRLVVVCRLVGRYS